MTGSRFLFPIVLFCFGLSAQALEPRLIVKYREQQYSQVSANSRTAKREMRKFVKLKREMSREEIEDKIEELKSNEADIDYIEVDTVLTIALNPGETSGTRDTHYNRQWALFSGPGGISIPDAWNHTTGNASTVVAVVDTGILAHPDLSGRVLQGVDMISTSTISNDGDGRDYDATDTGDFISYGDPCFEGQFKSSTWHGTHVAGTILANAGNGQGIAGINWRAKLLPVRVLGKCGGYSSDIADGIRWAVGASVSGMNSNPNPAKVVNLSLGGKGECGVTMQNAINEARNRGAVVVVAAGNDGASLDYNNYTPANCSGVIVVGANNSNGAKAGYSNYGSKVDLMAPGGDNYGGILSLSNLGSTYASTHDYKEMSGTSMATPHVAGIVSLIFAINPNFYPDQVKDILKRSVKSYSYYGCPTGGCGAGILDASYALRLATTEDPDSAFRTVDPIRSGGGDGSFISAQDSSGGGICGTVDFDNDGDSSNKGPFILTLMALMALILRFQFTGVKAFSPFRT